MRKILVVEDNEMIQEILSERLILRNFDVLVASDGQEGIELATKKMPDLILMDMSLPILDGWETTRRLKASTATSHIPIIALTAHALVEDREKSLEVGCDAFETKPINFSQLLQKIKLLLDDSA